MTVDDKASILYDYIVAGDSMESIADYNGINTSDVSAIVHAYGFNYQYQGSYQRGQHRGAYRNGFRYNYTYNNQRFTYTYQVDEDDIYDFVEQHPWATKENPCDYNEFELFLQDRAKIEAEAVIRQQQQARLEQQRRAEEQRRAAERQRQIDEENRRREAEHQRRIDEENRRRADEQRRINTFNILYNEGVQLYEKQQFNSAIAKFREAETIGTSDMLNVYIAYTLSKLSNSDDFANEIANRMYNRLATSDYNPSYSDYYIFASALLAFGNKNQACDNYFYAGDIAYEKEDYVLADKLYTEARQKTNFYSSKSKEAPFRIAFAMEHRENITDNDYQDIIFWYDKAIEQNIQIGCSYGNMSWWYIKLGRYEEAVSAAKKAISVGNNESYVYNNLVNAYWNMKDYNGVIDASNSANAHGHTPEYFKVGYSYFELGDYDASEAAYKECLRLKDIPGAYWNLALLYHDKKSLYSEAVKYAELAIQNYSQEDRDKYGAKALRFAQNANDTAAYNRMLQYLPKERERLEQERLEQERLKKERLEQERLEQERLEQERLERERLEQERLERERLEQERLERERLEQEKKKKVITRRRRDDEIVILF